MFNVLKDLLMADKDKTPPKEEVEEVLTKEQPYGKDGHVQCYSSDDMFDRAKKMAWYIMHGQSDRCVIVDYQTLVFEMTEILRLYERIDKEALQKKETSE